ncbi:hypothetical protein [Pseudomonas helmanticensis]|uniref:hypothetical protein n=1 Tax=Pseudomonas helmanticensis TaxID=1471381 RepID=UPI0024B7C0E6|nr:hypothetical protein [Pseudomonas helmanticensis]
MFAFLDGALAPGAIAFSIRHGTDSFLGGCLRLYRQALITSVGAAAGCDLLILFGIWIGIGIGLRLGIGLGLGAYPLLRVLPLTVSLLQRLTFPNAEK